MKKQKATFLILIFALVLTLLAGCKDEPHVHTFDEKWTYDNDSHWHKATCEHKEEKSDSAAHDLVSETIREATETQDGLIKVTCSVCGYSKEEPVKYSHTHTFSADWENNENNHWHKATCGHDVVDSKDGHSFVKKETTVTCEPAEVTYTCSVCGYEKKITERGKHNFDDDDICTVCKGYKCGDDVAAIFDETAKTLTVRGTGAMYDYQYSDYTGGKIKWSSQAFDKLIIEDGVTSIGEYSFYKSSVESAEIGKDVKKTNNFSFYNSNLETLSFSENSALYEIGGYSFFRTQLTSVELPSSVEILGTGAFQECSNLTDIKLNEGLQKIDADIVISTAVTELHLPSTYNPSKKNSSFVSFWNNSKLTTITVAEGNPYVKTVDGVLYSKDGKKLIGVPGGKTTVSIADTVETIGESAFYSWSGSSVTLPESVKTIEQNAFRGCANLVSVSMGSKVKTIDKTAFDYTPKNVEKLTITIAQPEGSISGYGKCWRTNTTTGTTKAIEVKWTGTPAT